MQTVEKKRDAYIQLECVCCGQPKLIRVNSKDLDEFFMPNRRGIQDIFPYLSAGEREMFLSGICSDCWTSIFGDEDD